jgi:Zn-dependent M28 family amino/carboxypeptidase
MRRSAVVLVLALAASACSSSTLPAPRSSPQTGQTSASPVAPTSPRGPGITGRTIWGHLEALQRIADRHGGTRAVGTPGYEASVEYVAGVLRDAGYEVEMPTVDVPAFEQEAPTVLERVGSDPLAWTDGTDVRAMLFSAGGDVRARVTAARGGCESADLVGFPEGDVALLRPGLCLRRQQVTNAQDAGASAVIFPYADTAPGRPLRPTLLYPDGLEIPVLAVTPGVGSALSARGSERPVVHIRVEASSPWVEDESVIAQTSGGDPDHVVMLAAHLDSVVDGPGINDNGSGVAVTLAAAQWLAGRATDAAVRIAFWAGEEVGLYGSRHYVQGLSPEERDAIVAYLDFDMVGSPNFVRFVLADPPMDPSVGEGNAAIRKLFTDYFQAEGLAVEPADTGGGGDHGPFAAAGIPIGGLFAGSIILKTQEQADVYGGEAGELMDACYHQACDTIRNVSRVALRQTYRAIVHVVTELASVEPAA